MIYTATSILAVSLATTPITLGQHSSVSTSINTKTSRPVNTWIEVRSDQTSESGIASQNIVAVTETSQPGNLDKRIELEARESVLLSPQLITIDELQGPSPFTLEKAKRWLICAKTLATEHSLTWRHPTIGTLGQTCTFEWYAKGRQLLVSLEGDTVGFDCVAIYGTHIQIDDGPISGQSDILNLVRIIAG